VEPLDVAAIRERELKEDQDGRLFASPPGWHTAAGVNDASETATGQTVVGAASSIGVLMQRYSQQGQPEKVEGELTLFLRSESWPVGSLNS
jgi:hypothetical protein